MLATVFWFMLAVGGFALPFCVIGMMWTSVEHEKIFMILWVCSLIFGTCAIIGWVGWALIHIF